MDEAELARRQAASQRGFYEAVVARAPSAWAQPVGDGALATVCPAAPDRSIVNAVVYADPAEVADHVDELAALYGDAGVRAWTVWVRPGDDRLAEVLALNGHAFDGMPRLMGAALDEIDLDGADRDLDLVEEPTWALIGEINDAAYGLDGALAHVLGRCDDQASALWIARHAGQPAACTVVRTAGDDAYVALVATRPQARRRGLAGALMRRALRAARDAGAVSTTLEASAMGEPVYAAMGYRPFGHFAFWERRTSA